MPFRPLPDNQLGVMDFDTLALRGGDARALKERPSTPTKPAEVLAALMDFSGGVALAELLQLPIPRGPSHPDAARSGAQLLDRVQAQLDAVSTRALQRLSRERRAESDIAASELLELVTRVRSARVAPELRKLLGWQLGTSLRHAQSEVARLRVNIALDVRALGPRADQLERIDAALGASMQQKLTDLYERLLRAAEQSFDRACLDACASLPPELGARDVANWLTPHAFIARDRERCERTVGAFCVHLRRAVEGLVIAAIRAEAAS